jgi:hypothetical protein
MANEEAQAVLFDCLKAGSVTLDVYIKVCRELAEQQFRSRLLGNKLQKEQHQRHAQAAPRATGVWGEVQGPQGGVLLPQGDAWRHTATYLPDNL